MMDKLIENDDIRLEIKGTLVKLEIKKKKVNQIFGDECRSKSKLLNLAGFRKGRKLSRDLFEKKMGGNKKAIYGIALNIFANNVIIDACKDEKILYVDNHNLYEDNGSWFATCTLITEPKLDIPDDLLENITIYNKPISQEEIDNHVSERIENFAKLNPILIHKLGKVVEGDMVEVKICAYCDGKIYKPLTEKSINIRVIRGAVIPQQLYYRLLGSSAGNYFEITTSDLKPNYKKALNNQHVLLKVWINFVYICKHPEVNNDLAITANFKNLRSWKADLADSGRRHIENNHKRIKYVQLLKHLCSKLKEVKVVNNYNYIDLPDEWAKVKIQDVFNSTGTEMTIDHIKRLYSEIIILKNIGDKFNIGWDDEDKDIYQRNEEAYAKKVLFHLLGMVNVVEDSNRFVR